MKLFRLLSMGLVLSAACSSPKKEAADMVFRNGKVYTINQEMPTAEAVAVKGNQIIFVGSSSDSDAFVGEDTEVVDVQGRTILPGFISGHDHVVGAGWLLVGVKLNEAKSMEEVLQLVKDYADANPDMEYILGNGWTFDQLGVRPTAEMLDKIISDRPVILTDFTCHEAWLNSKAMEMGNVSRDTKDVLPGVTYWERDSEGNPTGLGIEFQWLTTYIESGAWQPETGIRASAETMMGVAVRNGTTTVQVTGVVTPVFTNWELQKRDFAMAMEVLIDMKNEGSLPMRVFPMPIYKDVSATVEDFVGYAVDMSQKYNDDILRVQSIKIHPEGNWTAGGAPMIEPYLHTEGTGTFGVEPELSRDLVLAANEAGLNTIIHTDGDASARAAIDAFVAAKEAGFPNIRNAIHHMIWLHPDDYKRIVELKIPVNATPSFYNDWGGQDRQAYEYMGEERTETEYGKYVDLARDGVKVSISADVLSTPLTAQAPLFCVEAAVTLREPSEQGKSQPFPKTRKGMTVDQAIRSVTIDAAYHVQMEDKIGSLEVGKLADIVVLEADPYQVDPMQIEEIDVLLTMMDGKIVYQLEEAEPDTYDTDEVHISTGEFRSTEEDQ